MRARTKDEIVDAMNAELEAKLPGIIWNFSQNIRDNVMEALSGIKGDNSVKIFGPDLDKLEALADQGQERSCSRSGASRTSASSTSAASRTWSFASIPSNASGGACRRPTSTTSFRARLGGKALSQMIEGEKLFDISVRWPKRLRSSETDILDIPVDIINNTVVQNQGPGVVPTAVGTGLAGSLHGRDRSPTRPIHISSTPRLRLRDLVSPVGDDGEPDPDGQFERPGASTIYREQGKRLIAIKFSVREPRPGRRRGRGPGEDQGPLRGPLPRRLERRVRGNAGGRASADVHRARSRWR